MLRPTARDEPKSFRAVVTERKQNQLNLVDQQSTGRSVVNTKNQSSILQITNTSSGWLFVYLLACLLVARELFRNDLLG